MNWLALIKLIIEIIGMIPTMAAEKPTELEIKNRLHDCFDKNQEEMGVTNVSEWEEIIRHIAAIIYILLRRFQ